MYTDIIHIIMIVIHYFAYTEKYNNNEFILKQLSYSYLLSF